MGSSFPNRSVNVKLAENILRKDSVELFVYIEDEKLCKVYEKIINRLTSISPQNMKIEPLKSKKNVVEIFKQWLTNERVSSKSIFIVDRDFDHLKEIYIPNHNNLIELEYYTIENYLITSIGVTSLVQVKVHSKDKEEIISLLDYEKWLSEFYESFNILFMHFALAYKYELCENCGISPYRFLAKYSYQVDDNQIQQYISEIKKLCDQSNINYETEYLKIKREFEEDNQILYEKLIHGKYKFSSLLKYLNCIFKEKFDEDFSKVTLADYIDLGEMDFITARVNAVSG